MCDVLYEGDALRLTLRAMNIVVQKCVPVPGDRLYLRISCAVYNHFAEYELLRDAILLLAAKAELAIETTTGLETDTKIEATIP